MKTFFCTFCDASIQYEDDTGDVYVGVAAAVEHFRTLHPDVKMETWPDGAPVIIDGSLEPEDFVEEGDK